MSDTNDVYRGGNDHVLDATEFFDYNGTRESKAVIYLNEFSLDEQQEQAILAFAKAIQRETPYPELPEQALALELNLPQALQCTVEMYDLEGNGVEASKKADFMQLREDLVKMIAIIDALKFEE